MFENIRKGLAEKKVLKGIEREAAKASYAEHKDSVDKSQIELAIARGEAKGKLKAEDTSIAASFGIHSDVMAKLKSIDTKPLREKLAKAGEHANSAQEPIILGRAPDSFDMFGMPSQKKASRKKATPKKVLAKMKWRVTKRK